MPTAAAVPSSPPRTQAAAPGFVSRLDPLQAARVALMRFGLGPSGSTPLPNDFWTNPASAFNAAVQELDTPGIAVIDPASTDPNVLGPSPLLTEDEAKPLSCGRGDQLCYEQERRARYAKHMQPAIGFVERYVLFWMNHFNMFANTNPTVRAFIGSAERNIIRRNALGSFEEMLISVSQSPSMLTYLDGRNSNRIKTNQNFARELLELHTLGSSSDSSADRRVGASSNYSQGDVESLAKILTGWGFLHDEAYAPYRVDPSLVPNPGNRNYFVFMPHNHVGGPQTLLGKVFQSNKTPNASDVRQGIDALKFLAAHPLTAQRIARKLLCHFVSDTPSDASVDAIAQVFTDSNGNLKEVARALLLQEEAWTTPFQRVRQPYPWFISMMRAVKFDAGALLTMMAGNDVSPVTYQDMIDVTAGSGGYLPVMGQMPWNWRTPDGHPDRDSYWNNGEAIRLRANVAFSFLNNLQRYPNGVGKRVLPAGPDGLPSRKITTESEDKVFSGVPSISWARPNVSSINAGLWAGRLPAETLTAAAAARSGTTSNENAAIAVLFSSPEYLLT